MSQPQPLPAGQPGIETVEHEGRVLCFVIRASHHPTTTQFVTPGHYSQQLGLVVSPKGQRIPAHFHNRLSREVHYTQEVLVVRRGRVKATMYDQANQPAATVVLETGDTILLAEGGHGFEMLEDTELLDVKQGPYFGRASDKTVIGT